MNGRLGIAVLLGAIAGALLGLTFTIGAMFMRLRALERREGEL